MPDVPANPFREYKERHGLTYRELASTLGCSWDLARKLGSNGATVVSPGLAKQFERRTRGELSYSVVMAWVGDRIEISAGRRPLNGRARRTR